MLNISYIFFFSILILFVFTVSPNELIFVLLNQNDEYSINQSLNLKHHLYSQVESEMKPPVVTFLHKDFNEYGAWIIFPILPSLEEKYGDNSSWIIFCEPRTRFNLDNLVKLLSNYSLNEPVWIGHGLYDREPTIIHHFATHDKFKYPNLVGGFAMNTILLRNLVTRLNTEEGPQSDFSIDVSYEFSLFVWNKGEGTALTHSKLMCLNKRPNCATYPVPFTPCSNMPVLISNIFFAVKTCSKFHQSRVPIVLQTWVPHAKHFNLFSDASDSTISNLINLGIPNTEHGHCKKTMAILEHTAKIFKKNEDLQWLVLVDDDTIFSVSRIQDLLSCYSSRKLIALGERYGYRVHENNGYSYITGGGGTVLSREVVLKLTNSSDKQNMCVCPAPTSPDDMFMGVCLDRLNIPITHSPFFHQARPKDYAPEYLAVHIPVSFHKHWMIDPIQVYQQWFQEADHHNIHIEL